MRLWSYQAVAHGADTVMFFQMRRSIGACEKYHSAVIDHVGNENTRVFREITELGKELTKIKDQTLGTTIDSKVAIVFDWENWWASELSAGPSKLINYAGEICTYYNALYNLNISVDIVGTDADLSNYSLVLAPLLYMNKDGYDEKIREYVKNGGNYLTTFFSGYVDENDRVILGGYPGKQKDILGIWVEESDALPPENENSFNYKGKEYPAGVLCDIMHLQGAEEISVYEKEFYQGTPVLTKNNFGKGNVYYIGTHSNDEFYAEYLKDICEELNIKPVLKDVPTEVEVTVRENDEYKYLFILNHSEEEKEIMLDRSGIDILSDNEYSIGEKVVLSKKGVAIIKSTK